MPLFVSQVHRLLQPAQLYMCLSIQSLNVTSNNLYHTRLLDQHTVTCKLLNQCSLLSHCHAVTLSQSCSHTVTVMQSNITIAVTITVIALPSRLLSHSIFPPSGRSQQSNRFPCSQGQAQSHHSEFVSLGDGRLRSRVQADSV